MRAFGWLIGSALFLGSPALDAQNAVAEQQSTQNPALSAPPAQTLYASPEVWIERLSQASRSLNYTATFVAFHPGGEIQPYVWRHAVDDSGQSMEYLSRLNGPGREVLRFGNQVSYFEPDMPPYTLIAEMLNSPLPSQLLFEPSILAASYNFVLVGRSRVAGRSAQQIRLVSKDSSRFGYSIWLDQDSGLLLKINMVDDQGQVMEQVQIVDLTISDSPDPYFASVDRASLPDIVNIRPSSSRQYSWDIGFKPEGMRAVKRDIHRLPITGNIVEYMMLSDGMVDVSVYVQRADSVEEANAALRHQSNTLLTRQVGNVQITVVGKLPPQTANAIASSVTISSTKPQ